MVGRVAGGPTRPMVIVMTAAPGAAAGTDPPARKLVAPPPWTEALIVVAPGCRVADFPARLGGVLVDALRQLS
jgi:hypothetical protein